MRLFLTGATGLLGRRLVLDRLERGDQLVVASRDAAQAARLFAAESNPNITVVAADVVRPGPWQDAVAGCDAVVHLAGAGVADRRWNSAYRTLLVDSRVEGTRNVVAALARAAAGSAAQRPPRVLLSASAIGYYGERGDEAVDESAPPGRDFLARLCEAWETQALAADAAGVRTVLLRTGVVLDERGGALRRLLLPFRLGLGGPIGSGRGFMSWIHWRDWVGLVDFALRTESIRGPMNLTAPNPVTSRTFARALGSVLHRPALLPAPPVALRLVMGELGRYAAMSQRVVPAAAISRGYRFLYPDLEPALRSLLRGEERPAGDAAARGGPVPRGAGGGGAGDRRPAPTARIRLLALDVDGTLLQPDQRIARGVIHACRAAERAGCVVVLATARPPRTTRPIVQALGITAPTINDNGALIWNPLDDRPLFHQPLPGEIARAVVAEARRAAPEVLVGLEILDEWFTDRVDPRFEVETLRRVQPDYIGPLDEFYGRGVTKLNLIGLPRSLEALREPIESQFWKPRHVAMFRGDPHLLQITHPLVDKAMALQRIAARLGVRREEVMAVGEGINDAGMIEWSGFGVAVDNACPTVLSLARAVVPGAGGLGVARAIQRYVLAPKR
jgi:hypothetical protein